MKIDEETFLNGHKNATIEVKFLADNKATTYYNLLGDEEIEICFIKKLSKLFYFFDSLEDMKKGNQKVDIGIFAGQFVIASDYTSLSIVVNLENVFKITLICNISQ